MKDASAQGSLGPLLLLLSGPLVWFVHFNLIYSAAGFGEALGVGPVGVRLLAWGATLVAGAAIVALLLRARRGRQSAMDEMTRALAALSLWAVALQALALGMVPL